MAEFQKIKKPLDKSYIIYYYESYKITNNENNFLILFSNL